jgi:GTP-binding protein
MEIKDAKYVISSPSVEKCPTPDRAEVAFIGRSNVGKSSLINMLCNNTKLAKTSSIPGKTRLINLFEIQYSDPQKPKPPALYFVDLPGYGFAKVSQKDRRRWEQKTEEYIRKRVNLVNLFVLIDSRHKPQQPDLDFIGKLGKWGTPFAIVFTKADKNKPQVTEKNVNLFMEALRQTWEAPPVFFISSAATREGKKEILDFINNVNNQYQQ